eukprot:gene2201-1368_t
MDEREEESNRCTALNRYPVSLGEKTWFTRFTEVYAPYLYITM